VIEPDAKQRARITGSKPTVKTGTPLMRLIRPGDETVKADGAGLVRLSQENVTEQNMGCLPHE
jgi:hypothetical protein